MGYADKNRINIMKTLVMIVAAAIVVGLLTVTVAAQSEQEEPSYRTSTASIIWVENSGGGSGGGSSGGSSGGSDRVNSGGGIGVGGTTIIVGGTQEMVSIPSPGTSLGRLPETGGNYMIPLILIATGMFLLLAYMAGGRGEKSGIGT